MDVDEENALWTSEHGGRTYYFCHPACKETFDRDPGMFVD
jgi:YHS domain-containing protein